MRRSSQVSNLARQIFDALQPWINVKCSGQWYVPDHGDPHPIYFIRQQAYKLLERWINGERDLFYTDKDGKKRGAFFPSHLKSYLKPHHIAEMIAGQCKFYYTGGRRGKTLLMIDVDAHESWQTDAWKTVQQIVDLLGAENCFVVESTRGYNVFVKWLYMEPEPFQIWGVTVWKKANKLIRTLESALKRLTAHCQSCVEVKGTITLSSDHYGSLAKLPCFGAWTEDRLREFRDLQMVDTDFIKSMIGKIEKSTPKAARAMKLKVGSCDSFTLSQEEIDRIPKLVKMLKSRSWYCDSRKAHVKKEGVKLVPLDFAYAFVVLSLARRHRNEKFGEQMPENFIQAIWQVLYNYGYFTRAFDTSRWTAIRNTLADCGFLLYVSNRYWFDKHGEKKGKAMEFRLLDEYDVLLAQEEGEEVNIEEVYPVHEPSRWRPLFVNPQNPHYRLIGRLEGWEEDEYGGVLEAMAA